MIRLTDRLVFLALFGLLLFVSLNRHSHHSAFVYQSQIFTDKAGYHVYLPAFFYYDMDGSAMPKDIDIKTGTGFLIKGDKIVTKYPIGVALFELPFFGLAAAYDAYQGVTAYKGYTHSHHIAINWSGVFYGTLGLYIFFLVATRFWNLSRKKAYLLVVLVLGCSNLLYYITRDPGMSHLYSFTVFTAILYVFYAVLQQVIVKPKHLILLLTLSSFVVVLRPLNLAFIAFPILYLLYTSRKILGELRFEKPGIGLSVGFVFASIPIVLQLIYYNYAYGSFVADSYANESFSRWNQLELHTFWFGANNGVFVYIPILILPFIWMYDCVKTKAYASLLFLLYFLSISVTYAAWWSPTLGCGFGHRGFTEHLAFFALPMAGVIQHWKERTTNVVWMVAGVIFLLLFSAQYTFDDCWRGNGPWDWSEYFRLFGF